MKLAKNFSWAMSFLLFIDVCGSHAAELTIKDTPQLTSSQGEEYSEWPNLALYKYINERPATEKDVNDGAAAFYLQLEGQSISVPLFIQIPQHAMYINSETGEKTKVVIIQAEKANGQKVLGAVLIKSNKRLVGLHHEFQLLGNLNSMSYQVESRLR